jgi:uncharacterized protein (TIGR03435 family)
MTPRKNVRDLLSHSLPSASKQDVQAAGGRVFERLQSDPDRAPSRQVMPFEPVPRTTPQAWRVATIGAAIAVAVLISATIFQRVPVVDDVRRVEFGDVVRSNAGVGYTLFLPDGSRVEMRANSELALERAEDGIRIRLNRGDIIVKAAKQAKGHLYVQTKHMSVSVVGTVFLVNAKEEGSRVAVIEGEVQVTHGGIATKLLPGEQATSNPAMAALSVKEEVSWSREAESHAALLQQAPKEPPLAFETASIRPTAPFVPGTGGRIGAGGGGQGDGSANRRPSPWGCVPDSSNMQQIDPSRLYIPMATLAQLIAHTYPIQNYPGWVRTLSPEADGNFATPSGERCGMLGRMGLLAGGPEWVRTEQWDLQATIPAGVFTSKPNVLTDPKLQQMLQALLKERFQLEIRRETKEVPVYMLKVAKDGPSKFLKEYSGASNEITFPRGGRFTLDPSGGVGFNSSLNTVRGMWGQNVSMEVLAQSLAGGPGGVGRLVFDRTGIIGRYDFQVEVAEVPIDRQGGPESLERTYSTVKRDALKALGLELEESRMPFEVWVIERAEKPTDN